ncbi:hypothetical protein [Haloarcula halophila]|uniref:hypothetical protein n=1 Tax=Haloarcula TaxID=2237 RepID=UPI0023E421F4|nr:hypothetical protein [Halomicroarcula sp. DFY41]
MGVPAHLAVLYRFVQRGEFGVDDAVAVAGPATETARDTRHTGGRERSQEPTPVSVRYLGSHASLGIHRSGT